MNKNRSVFINCPFDKDFKPLFDAITFTVFDCGFIARSAYEIDSGGTRIDGLVQMMKECRYGIHDISRIQLDKGSNLPRFNMPFELGLFYGLKTLGRSKKEFVVINTTKHRHQKFLSDLAGVDAHPHKNKRTKIIAEVRDWLLTVSHDTKIPRASDIQTRFRQFDKFYAGVCAKKKTKPENVPFVEFTIGISDWLSGNHSKRFSGLLT